MNNEFQYGVVDMDGVVLTIGTAARVAAWLKEDAEEHRQLRGEPHGAYSDCYWPRSVFHTACGCTRCGQHSTYWACNCGEDVAAEIAEACGEDY